MKKISRCTSGASAVEFAMLLPIFLTIVFGIVVFGSYLTMVHGVQQLAAEAARTSVAGLSDDERKSLASNYVTANASTYPLLVASNLSVVAAAHPANANVYVVTVNYDTSSSILLNLPFVPSPSSTIVRSAAIPYGGF